MSNSDATNAKVNKKLDSKDWRGKERPERNHEIFKVENKETVSEKAKKNKNRRKRESNKRSSWFEKEQS